MCLKKIFCPDPPDIEELKKKIEQLEKLNEELGEKAAALDFPAPPDSEETIDANALFKIIGPYGISLSGGSGDYRYKLMTPDDARRFTAWFHDSGPVKPSHYESDDFDCEDFARINWAWAALWMKSRYLWGYIEAESADPDYPFGNHGFNFVVTSGGKVWYYDRLGVAGYDNDIIEAYPIKCYAAKA